MSLMPNNPRGGDSPAMRATLAQIAVAFGEPAVHKAFKRRVRYFIALGTGHIEIHKRYGRRADMLRHDGIDGAICRVEQWWKDERRVHQTASLFNRMPPRLSMMALAELRLILRLLRANGLSEHFPAIVRLVR